MENKSSSHVAHNKFKVGPLASSLSSVSAVESPTSTRLPGKVIRSSSDANINGQTSVIKRPSSACKANIHSSYSFAGHTPPPSEIRSRKKSDKSDVRTHDNDQVELATLDRPVHSSSSDRPGQGHRFISANLFSPTWCDKCGDFIWGMYKQCLICTNCHFTCHHSCHPLVTLDCSEFSSRPHYSGMVHRETSFVAADNETLPDSQCTPAYDNNLFHRSPSKRRWIFDSLKAHAIFYSGESIEESEPDNGYSNGHNEYQPSERTLTRDDLRRRINAFNTNNHGLVIEMPTGDDNTFHGFIRVHMNLIRPINMCISVEPPTLFDISGDTRQDVKGVEFTSFYLPKGTTKVIHISSHTTTQEVIRILLSKYHIADNPRKFVLYERTTEPGRKGVLRRMADDEVPLQICLSWTGDSVDQLDHYQFVLQENDTGEIMWEAFSLPELENFLLVLNREEEEYISQLKDKYRLLTIQMRKRLQSLEAKRNTATDKRTPVFV